MSTLSNTTQHVVTQTEHFIETPEESFDKYITTGFPTDTDGEYLELALSPEEQLSEPSYDINEEVNEDNLFFQDTRVDEEPLHVPASLSLHEQEILPPEEKRTHAHQWRHRHHQCFQTTTGLVPSRNSLLMIPLRTPPKVTPSKKRKDKEGSTYFLIKNREFVSQLSKQNELKRTGSDTSPAPVIPSQSRWPATVAPSTPESNQPFKHILFNHFSSPFHEKT